MTKMWPGCGQDVVKVWPGHSLDVALISSEYGHDMTRRWPGHSQNIFRIWPGGDQEVTMVWLECRQDVTSVWLGFLSSKISPQPPTKCFAWSAAVANMDATEIANAKKLACYVLSCALDVVGWIVRIVTGMRQMLHKLFLSAKICKHHLISLE